MSQLNQRLLRDLRLRCDLVALQDIAIRQEHHLVLSHGEVKVGKSRILVARGYAFYQQVSLVVIKAYRSPVYLGVCVARHCCSDGFDGLLQVRNLGCSGLIPLTPFSESALFRAGCQLQRLLANETHCASILCSFKASNLLQFGICLPKKFPGPLSTNI